MIKKTFALIFVSLILLSCASNIGARSTDWTRPSQSQLNAYQETLEKKCEQGDKDACKEIDVEK